MLFKACKIVNIPCILGGSGLALLVYFCATNLRDIYVINGNERGTKFACITSIDQETKQQLLKTHVFLDNETGDIYSYSDEKNVWYADGNCGLHYISSSETYGSMGAYFTKSKSYKVKPLKENEVNYIETYETLCTLKKQFTQHWLFKDCQHEFKVPKKNKWDAHPINVQKDYIANVGTNYTVLAESDRGPQVIEHKTTIAVQFHFDINNDNCIKIITNFISSKSGELRNRKHSHINLDEAYLNSKQCFVELDDINTAVASPHNLKKSNSSLRASTSKPREEIRPQTMRFLHSGLNYSKRRGELIVHNNAFGSYVKVVPTTAANSVDVSKSKIDKSRPYTAYSSRLSKPKSKTSQCDSESRYETLIKKTVQNLSQFDKQESMQLHSQIQSQLTQGLYGISSNIQREVRGLH